MTQGGTAFDLGTTPFRLRGLGLGSLTPTECEMYGSNPPPGCPGNSSSGSGTTGKTFDWNKAADVGNKILDIFGGGGRTSPIVSDEHVPTPGSNKLKTILIVGGVLAAAGITYAIVRATKKKKK